MIYPQFAGLDSLACVIRNLRRIFTMNIQKLLLIVCIATSVVVMWNGICSGAPLVAGGPRVISGGGVLFTAEPVIYSVQLNIFIGPAEDLVSIAVQIDGVGDGV